jgi:predicted Zn-dependent peptidase
MKLSLPTLSLIAMLAACRGDSTSGAIQNNTSSGNSNAHTPVADASSSLVADASTATPEPNNTAQLVEPEPLPDVPARETPDAEFRRSAPPAGRPGRFVAPRIQRFQLANGMRVYLVEQHQLPIVVAQYVTRRGGDDVPVEQAGIAHMTASLLEQGTTSLGAEQLSDAFAAIGAQHATTMEWDSGGAYVKVLAPHFERAVELLADVIQHPAFANDEIERWRARQVAEIRAARDSPRVVAGTVIARAVYGDAHPYSRPLTGVESSVRAITRDQVVQFYRSHFVPQDSALVIAGDITLAQLRPMLERSFGQWRQEAPATPLAAVRPAVPAAPSGPARVWLVDWPRAPQSMVYFASEGVARNNADFERIQVANAILGEVFSSRINLNLREAHAYTYGARSRFAFRRGAGPFTAGGAMITRHTADAATEILNEVRRIRESNVTADELTTARTAIVEGFRAQFATAEGTADAVSDLFVYDLPDSFVASYPRNVERVTARDVRRVLTERLDPAKLHLVVVGDRAMVSEGLDALRRGPIELRDHEGAAVNTTASETTQRTDARAADAGR